MKHIFILTFTLFLLPSLHSQSVYKDSIQQLRVEHTGELIDPSKKILSDEEIDHFEGLDYFNIDASMKVIAKFEYSKGKKFKMPTSTERTPIYRRYGFVYFEIAGQKCTLTVYQNMELIKKEGFKDYLFIPFKDATSGKESYGGGRYLDLRIPSSTAIVLDFNTCYNPYCAYSMRYSCPSPPAENTLNINIEAGEKIPLGH